MDNTEGRKRLLLEQIASEGYNVGYTSALHFATHDLACKFPGWVTLLSIAVGALSLFSDAFAAKWLSATLLVIGVGSMYVRYYEERLACYEKVAKHLNANFKELQDLSNRVEVKSPITDSQLDAFHAELVIIRNSVRGESIARQVFLANWIAHYKLFWVWESGWFAKYRNPPLRLFRDKIPLSFTVVAFALLIALLACGSRFAMDGLKELGCIG